MRFDATPLAGVWVVTPAPRTDERGSFTRLFGTVEFAPLGQLKPWRQLNHSRTRRAGIVRGLHLQFGSHAETKLVRCLRGRVYDVAVDLRPDSATFGHWHAIELVPDGPALFIPPGCAHGFQALKDDAEILYLNDADYRPDHEGGVRCDDPQLGIAWPLAPVGLSSRDQRLPTLAEFVAQSMPAAA